MKDSFIMYTQYMEQIELLDMEQRGTLLTALMMYQMQKELPAMDGATSMCFAFIKARIDIDAQKYEEKCRINAVNGRKGGRSKKDKSIHSVNEVAEEILSERFSEKANGSDRFFGKANESECKRTEAKKPDIDNDIDIKEKELPKGSSKKKSVSFCPPTPEQVTEYCREKGYDSVDPQRFVDFYESKGWMVGKNKMKDWKAAVRNWSRTQRQELTAKASRRQEPTAKGNKFLNFQERDNRDVTEALLRQSMEHEGCGRER